jgi:hypothetical protein
MSEAKLDPFRKSRNHMFGETLSTHLLENLNPYHSNDNWNFLICFLEMIIRFWKNGALAGI